ncbi:MAG: MinD/ParA family protein [Alphaproteobacteria bacterium]|nr:MinD/ParA family protein [Alphaproteobacteria bacterium]
MNTSPTLTPPLRGQNIIAVASGKGGVGKTWFSITLAGLFARAGRKTLLFDGDIGLANVDVQLGLTPTRDLGAVFAGQCSMRDAITHYEKGKFDILAGRSGSTSMANLGANRMQPAAVQLVALAESYDFVIIDLGAGIEQHVQVMSALASKVIVVLTDDPTSLTDAYAFIKLCITREQPPAVHVVVNQAASQKEGESTYAAINRATTNFLKFSPPLLGVIRKDNKVRDAIRSQSSLLETAPHTTAASDAATISIKLMKKD